jgi:hypothetical protein
MLQAPEAGVPQMIPVPTGTQSLLITVTGFSETSTFCILVPLNAREGRMEMLFDATENCSRLDSWATAATGNAFNELLFNAKDRTRLNPVNEEPGISASLLLENVRFK